MTAGTFKRSMFNVQIPAYWEREFIWTDMIRGSQAYIFGYLAYGETNAEGWSITTGIPVPSAIIPLPTLAMYGGYYVLTGKGAGTVSIKVAFQSTSYSTVAAGTPVTQDGVTYPAGFNFTVASNGVYNVTDSGSGWRIIVSRTDHQVSADPARIGFSPTATNTGGGGYITDCHFYRIDDEADFLAGNWYNSRWKKTLVDLNPCAIRFMDWTTGSGQTFLWGDRTPPTYFSAYADVPNLGTTLKYTLGTYFSGGDNTSFLVDAVAGTPVSYKQGELVYTPVMADWSTAQGTTSHGDTIVAAGPDTVNPAYTKLTTLNGYTYAVGDVLQFFNVGGMYRLDRMIGTVQTVGVGGAKNLVVDIDCRAFNLPAAWSGGTAYSTANTVLGSDSNVYFALSGTTGVDPTTDGGVHWANNGPTAFLSATAIPVGNRNNGSLAVYVTLNVGGRGAAPIMLYQGTIPLSTFGQGYLYGGAGSTRPFLYDKNLIRSKDASGNLTFGVWTTNNAPNATYSPPTGNVATEYCLKLTNELEAMIIATGQSATKGPINPWINVNCYGMLSTDPDYTLANHVGIGMTDVMLNGNSTLGIAGMPSRCSLFIEFSNETWNEPGGFNDYCNAIAYGRWGSSLVGYNDAADGSTLRAVQMVQDIKAAFPSATQLKFVMGGQDAAALGTVNTYRINGTSTLFNDSAATATIVPGATPVYYGTAYGSVAPITLGFWGFATAPYYNESVAWDTANLATAVTSWKSNGQKTISSVSAALPAHVVTTAPHGFNNGDLVGLTNMAQGTFTGFIDDGLGGGSYDGTPGTTLTVTGVTTGAISLANTKPHIIGSGINPATAITAHGSGSGGTGTYTAQYLVNNVVVPQASPSVTFVVNADDWDDYTLNLYGYVANATSTEFDILGIDSTILSPLFGGNVTRLNGSDQETLYSSYLQWMLIDNGNGAYTLPTAKAVSQELCGILVPYGVVHVHYEGWEQMIAQASGAPTGNTDALAFIAGCKRSQSLATMMTTHLAQHKAIYGAFMPGIFTQEDPGRWGLIFPNAYSFSPDGTAWKGLSPAWDAMVMYNATASTMTIAVTPT